MAPVASEVSVRRPLLRLHSFHYSSILLERLIRACFLFRHYYNVYLVAG
jgi:hypothetical protein